MTIPPFPLDIVCTPPGKHSRTPRPKEGGDAERETGGREIEREKREGGSSFGGMWAGGKLGTPATVVRRGGGEGGGAGENQSGGGSRSREEEGGGVGGGLFG